MRPPCVVRRGASASRGVPQVSRRPPPTRGIGLPRGFRGHSAGRRTRGASVLAGVPRPMRAAVHAGPRPPRGHSAGLPQAAATRGASVLAGVPQASRRPPPQAGHRPSRAFRRPPAVRRRTRGLGLSRAFRGPRRPPPTRGIGPRGHSATHAGRCTRGASVLAGPRRRSAGLPPPAATHGASALAAHAALAGVSQAARARSQPAPAARFSRKPPCGIGSRMVYCT